MDSIMRMASIGDLFALINVFAGDTIPSVAKWTLATLKRTIGEAGAPCAGKAWVGETTICRHENLKLLD